VGGGGGAGEEGGGANDCDGVCRYPLRSLTGCFRRTKLTLSLTSSSSLSSSFPLLLRCALVDLLPW
jgi:hypothetical protein